MLLAIPGHLIVPELLLLRTRDTDLRFRDSPGHSRTFSHPKWMSDIPNANQCRQCINNIGEHSLLLVRRARSHRAICRILPGNALETRSPTPAELMPKEPMHQHTVGIQSLQGGRGRGFRHRGFSSDSCCRNERMPFVATS